MADVFVSYAREDQAKARAIAEALTAQGVETFWDNDIPPGRTWADFLEAKVRQSRVMIVIWSAASTASQWVREEARIGRDAGKLMPVVIDGASPPFGFGEVQAADLSGWDGDPQHPGWQRLVAAVRSAIAEGVAGAPQQGGAQTAGSRPLPPPPPPPFGSAAAAKPAVGGAIDRAQPLSPVGYVQKCLRLYAVGAGRAGQAEFWWFVLFLFLCGLAATVVDIVLFGINPYSGAPNASIVSLVVGLGLLAPGISVASRRLHDIGVTGWLAFLGVIPYLGFVFVIVVGLVPSKPGDNQYGPSPLAA